MIELAEEAEFEPDSGPVAVALAVPAAVPAGVVAVDAPVALAVPDVVAAPGFVPMFSFPSPEVHLPSRPENCEASLTAAGVEPQLLYCCMWIWLLSRSKTAEAAVSKKNRQLHS